MLMSEALVSALCMEWTGQTVSELKMLRSGYSSWNTGAFTYVTTDAGEGPHPSTFFACGRVDGDAGSALTGVCVHVSDGYGNIYITINGFGGECEMQLHYKSGCNEIVSVRNAVDRIKAMVETACQDLTRVFLHRGIRPVNSLDEAEVQSIKDELGDMFYY